MTQEWTGQTGGTYNMQRALIWLFKHMNIHVMYGIMHLWLIWYIIVRPSATRAVYQFHRRRGRNRIQALPDVYRSYCHFGKAVLDRFAVYAGHKFDIVLTNEECYYNKVKDRTGFILLFSHLGNSEMAAYSLATPDKKMNVLVFGGESPVVMENRAKAFEANNVGIITMYPNKIDHIFTINKAISRGEILATAGDRNLSDKTIYCDFMGRKAPLPAGIFQLCATINCPVLLTFVIKDKGNIYQVYTEALHINGKHTKADNTKLLAQQFANRLEEMAFKYPYEWFNFYNFWTE